MDEQPTPDAQTPSEAPTPPESLVPPDLTATDVTAPAAEAIGEAVEEKAPAKKAMSGGKWTLIVGALVIIAGLVYLLYELGWWSGQKDVSHWWGFLILIGTVIAWGIGWWVWNKNERRFGWKVLRWFVIGLALVALALVFAFKKDLNEVWPVLAIIVGVGIALSWKG